MAVKPANDKLQDTISFLKNLKTATAQIEEFKKRMETDPAFRKLWETDSAQALRQVGIDPEARTAMGLPSYDRGPECNWCITPQGNACHC